MKKNTLIFDLDGTIADTAPDLIGTLNRIIAPHGVAPVEIGDVGQVVGHGAKAMIRKAFSYGGHDLSGAKENELFAEFLNDYQANIANDTQLFEGLLEAMDSLRKDGFGFCVCTNKMESLAKTLLKKLDIDNYFSALTGGDTFAFRKPDGRHLIETLKLIDRETGSAVMIGDSATDINAAKDAGIPSVAVTFGYSDKPVSELGATAIIDHFDELEKAVKRIAETN